MLNATEAYQECGRKAGIARNEHDESRALFHTGHFHRMLTLETANNRKTAREVFNEAYRTARNVPKVPQ